MRRLIVAFLCYVGRFLISLRYRVKVRGKKELFSYCFNKKRGILFLPNHPAHIDPILLGMILWPRFQVHPLVVEYIHRQSGIHLVMKLIGAISVPNLETSLNEVKLQRVKATIQEMGEGLKRGENYLLYPAGRLKHTAKEILGGASATYHVLEGCPDANVVLIRTTGLWGSSFSRAYTTKAPDFKKRVVHGLKKLLSNGIFFMPRREVVIDILPEPEDFPRKVSRLELNRYLEKWYNRYPTDDRVVESEPLSLVSYYFWKKKYFKEEIKKIEEKKIQKGAFSSKVEEEVFAELSKFLPDVEITPNMNLSTDLGLDSLDMAELISFLSLHYDIGEVHPADVQTVHDVLEAAEGRKRITTKKGEKKEYRWPEERKRKPPRIPIGDTIQEAFFHICDVMKDAFACGDDVVGVITYRRLKLAALVLSKEIKRMPGNHIGVLLPASVGAYMVILATLLADKVPVMLNWTLGPRYLNNMMQLTDSNVVVSSWRFMERLSNVEFGFLTKKMRFLEDIKKKIPKGRKAVSFLQSYRRGRGLLRQLKLDKKSEDDIAVILFTSGTEASPKGVPLTHKNILSNLRAAMSCIDITEKDVLYGILPPFHSFGFSVTGIFPIVAGLRVAFFPDPTDSYSLAEGINRWKATLLCTAPSFLKGLLYAAREEELASMQLFVSGAEKTPSELFEKVAKLGEDKQLIEGYGITECAPIITLNRPSLPRKGVGQPLPGIEICTVDPEKHDLLKRGEEGELCVKGPNVFGGYLGAQRSPFIKIEDEKWYCTGDLGYVEEDGSVILSGRLKRFTKIAGEMISLGGVEEIILQALKAKKRWVEDGVPIAIVAHEKDGGKTSLILFTSISLDKKDVNLILKEAGFSRLVKISSVKKMDHIPLMGTGKTDYRFLQSMIE